MFPLFPHIYTQISKLKGTDNSPYTVYTQKVTFEKSSATKKSHNPTPNPIFRDILHFTSSFSCIHCIQHHTLS